MLKTIIFSSLKNRLLVSVFILGLIVSGIIAIQNLPIDAFPDVSSTQVKIILKSPGLTPEEVETRIIAPVEVELLGLPKKTMVRATAKYGLADITVDFEDGTDIYWARQQVNERLSGVWNNLPDGLMGGIAPMSTPLSEVFMFTINGDNLTLEQKRTLLDWVIRPRLRSVKGIADINTIGGFVRSFEITPDVIKMNARGIAVNQLKQAILDNNKNDGSGRIKEGEETLIVRAEGRFITLDDIKNTVIRVIEGTPIRIQDVAQVKIGALTRYGAVSQDGKGETVQGIALTLRGSNARQVIADVRQKLEEIKSFLPEGVEIQVFYDRSDLTNHAITGVSRALLEAMVLVMILLTLFLGNFRSALNVALILPLSAFATFILMQQFGLSANLMSLGGLSIAIGMLVDSAVVIVENISTHFAQSGNKEIGKLELIFASSKEVAPSIISSIFIIIVVFLPLLTLEGLEGKLFAPVALTIVFALLSSLFLSLTVIPVLSSYLLKKGEHDDSWLTRKTLTIYDSLLHWALKNTKMVVIITVIALIGAIGVYTRIGKIFMPTMDEGDLIVSVEKLPSIGLKESISMDSAVQKRLLEKFPEIIEIISRTGSDEIGLDPMGLNQTDFFIMLKPHDQWRFASKEILVNKIRETLQEFPGMVLIFTQPIEMRVNEMLLGVRGDLAIKVFGPDIDTLSDYAQQIKKILTKIQGSRDVYTPQNEGAQYLRLQIDRVHAGRLGFSINEIESTLYSTIEGARLGVVQEADRRTPVLLRGDQTLTATELSELQIANQNGVHVPLSHLAKLTRSAGPIKIDHENAVRMVVVVSNVAQRDLVSFVEEAKQEVAKKINFKEGYYLKWGGQFENQQRSAKRLGLVIPVALALIFLLLYSTFSSLKQASIIICNIPFALIGGVFSLWISGQYISVPASVGFIALLGIAVLNGVVMVSYFNQLSQQGIPIDQIIIEGAKRRLRPVLMTASITIFGLVPLLFAQGPGSEIQRPLAIVVIGGLISATFLTLILLPLMYKRFGR